MKCPGCGKSFNVPDEYIGRRVQCNKCGEQFVVTAPEQVLEAILEPEPADDPFPDPFADEPQPEPAAAAAFEDDEDEIDEELEELLDTLQGGKKKQRREAARQIRDLADPASLDVLMDCMGDKDVEVRRYIAEALGEIGGKVALAGLIGMASDDDLMVQIHAFEGMFYMPESADIQFLAHFHLLEIIWHQYSALLEALDKIARGKLKESPYVARRLFWRCDSMYRNPNFEQALKLDAKLDVKKYRSHFAACCQEFGIEVPFD